MNVLNSFSLKGKVALLTGGAGLYGRQIVDALAEAGAETYIASRNIEALEAEAEKRRARDLNVKALKLDLAVEQSMNDVVEKIVDECGKIDILVNNAVTRVACGGWDLSMDDFDKSLRVNASALFHLTRICGDEMKKHGKGSIINIGSIMGMIGIEMANYVGTDMNLNPSPIYFYEKGGMINFTRWAASLLGKHNIRVNCVSPGGLMTEDSPQRFVRQYNERTQLGRMAQDQDLKGAIVFLASDASNYITGVNLPVDGGYTAK